MTTAGVRGTNTAGAIKQCAYDKDEHSWNEKDANRDRDRTISSVPDGGPGIVLLTTTSVRCCFIRGGSFPALRHNLCPTGYD
jgi:hypothetical protein